MKWKDLTPIEVLFLLELIYLRWMSLHRCNKPQNIGSVVYVNHLWDSDIVGRGLTQDWVKQPVHGYVGGTCSHPTRKAVNGLVRSPPDIEAYLYGITLCRPTGKGWWPTQWMTHHPRSTSLYNAILLSFLQTYVEPLLFTPHIRFWPPWKLRPRFSAHNQRCSVRASLPAAFVRCLVLARPIYVCIVRVEVFRGK